MTDHEQTDEQTEALSIVPRLPSGVAQRSFSLLPGTMAEAMEMARMIADSDFAPKQYKGKPTNVLIAIQMGADIGLKPMVALQNIAVINGRPSIWGDGALALVRGAGVVDKFKETIEGEGDKRAATCVLKRKGDSDETVNTFSVADAKKANLWGKEGPWSTYPDRMLKMRARSFTLRDAAPDILMGLVLTEEAMDYPDAIDTVATRVESVPASNPIEKVPEGLRDTVEKAFEALRLTAGQRVVKLNSFMGDEGTAEDNAAKLLNWCRDEYSKMKTGLPRKVTDNKKDAGKPAEAAAGAVTGAPAPGPTPSSGPVDPKGAESGDSAAGREASSAGSGHETPPTKAVEAESVKSGDIPWGNQGTGKAPKPVDGAWTF